MRYKMQRVLHQPDLDTRERIPEIGEILALGLIRLHARKSSQFAVDSGECSLDCLATQSGDAKQVLQASERPA